MSIEIERVPGESVRVAPLKGYIDVQVVQRLAAETARLGQQIGGHVYRIAHITGLQSSLADTLAIVSQESKGALGSITDPRVTTMLIGENKWITFARDALGQQRAVNVALFDSMEEVLVYIRFQRAKRRTLQ